MILIVAFCSVLMWKLSDVCGVTMGICPRPASWNMPGTSQITYFVEIYIKIIIRALSVELIRYIYLFRLELEFL